MTGTVETPIPGMLDDLLTRLDSTVLPAHEPVVPAQAAIVWERWAGRSPVHVAGGLQAMLRVLAAQGGWAGDWRLVPLGAESMTAATRFDTKQVALTFGPLLDTRLSPNQRGAVMLSGLLHEVGHVVDTQRYDQTVRSYVAGHMYEAPAGLRARPGRNRQAWLDRAMAYTNLLEDVRTEADTARTFPVFGHLLPMVRWWIVSKRPVGTLALPEYRDEVFGFAVAVTRYRQWATQPAGVRLDREVSWWVEWMDRWANVDPWTRITGLWEAIDHENKRPQRPAPVEPPPPPPTDDEPQPSDEDWDQGGGTAMPDEDEDPDDETDGDDEPDDEDESTSGDGDEDDEDPDEGDPDDESDAGAGAEPDEDPDEDEPETPDASDEDPDLPDDEDDDDGPGSGLKGDDVSNPGDDEDGDEDDVEDEDDGLGDDEDSIEDEDDEVPPAAPAGPPPPMPLHAQDVLTNPEQDAAALLGQAVVVSQSLGDSVVTVWADGTDRNEPDRTYWLAEPSQPGTGPLDPVDGSRPYPRFTVKAQAMPPEQVIHRSVAMQHGEWVDNHTLSYRVRSQIVDVKRLPVSTSRYQYRGYETDTVEADPAAARALREAFRVGRSRWTAPVLGHSGVRLDSRRVHRLGGDDSRVFIRGGAHSPDLLDVHLLVDRSRSMLSQGLDGRTRLDRAHSLIQSLALALRQEQHVQLTVWSESDSQGIHGDAGELIAQAMLAAGREDPHSWVYRHWTTRDGYTTLHQRLQSLQAFGGFHDGTAIQTVASQIEVQPKTRTVLIVLSDGEPLESMGFVAKAVLAARRKGIEVFGVGMADGLTEAHVQMYGVKRVIPFTGDWNALGRRLAQVLGRLLA